MLARCVSRKLLEGNAVRAFVWGLFEVIGFDGDSHAPLLHDWCTRLCEPIGLRWIHLSVSLEPREVCLYCVQYDTVQHYAKTRDTRACLTKFVTRASRDIRIFKPLQYNCFINAICVKYVPARCIPLGGSKQYALHRGYAANGTRNVFFE